MGREGDDWSIIICVSIMSREEDGDDTPSLAVSRHDTWPHANTPGPLHHVLWWRKRREPRGGEECQVLRQSISGQQIIHTYKHRNQKAHSENCIFGIKLGTSYHS